MHIPDGILKTPLIAITYTFTIVSIGFVWKRIKNHLNEKTIPKVGLLAAFLFVAQMVNIPVSGGTSAHLAGGTLTVLIVGPALGIFVMVLILTVQLFIFQDGGLLAWGANVLNIGIIPILVSFFFFSIYYKLSKKYTRLTPLRIAVIFLVGWISIQTSAIFVGLELGLSGLAPLEKIVSLMVIIHSGVSILEGLLTVMIFELIRANRPDMIFSFLPQPGMLNE